MMLGVLGLIIFGICGGIFFAIGVYANNLAIPMWFWAGDKIPKHKIKDVKKYNRANSRMWKVYSIPYWVAALLSFRNMMLSGIIVLISCTVGIVFLIICYEKIEKKYKI